MIRFCFIILISFIVSACSTVSLKRGPAFGDWDKGENRHFVEVTFVNTNAFAPSSINIVLLECKLLLGDSVIEDMDDYERLERSQCRVAQDAGNYGLGSGALPGLVQGAAVVGGAHLVGKGISESGDKNKTTNTTSLSSSSTNATSVSAAASNSSDDISTGGLKVNGNCADCSETTNLGVGITPAN